jgi:hypothetical protein
MIPTRLLTLSAEHVARNQTGPNDAHGSPTWEEDSPVAFSMWRRPLSSAELADRPGGRATYVGYWTADLGATSNDKITLAIGQTFEIEGPVREHINPRNGRNYFEADLIEYGE